MPRDGSGASDNVVEETHNIVHGSSESDKDTPAGSNVDRSSKAAPPPEPEKGEALEGMAASGGGDKATGSGKGSIETTADKEAKK